MTNFDLMLSSSDDEYSQIIILFLVSQYQSSSLKTKTNPVAKRTTEPYPDSQVIL